jgi:hypothetical protein
MHWDGTVTLGNVLTMAVVLFPVLRFWVVLTDFPPHRHARGYIIYPKGMAPKKDDIDEVMLNGK